MELQTIKKMGMRVLTSRQLAEAYETEPIQIQQNYANNKMRYVEGKHYFFLVGEELRRFKSDFENFEVVARTTNSPSMIEYFMEGNFRIKNSF